MAEYKIVRLSSKPPRNWSFKDKNNGADVQMETYKVMVEGEDEPVEVNKKPGNVPKVGDVLSGTLEDSEFGKKFKPDKKAFSGGGGNYVDHHEDIQIQWAIGQAIQIGMTTSDLKPSDIESQAKQLLSIVNRIKNPQTPAEDALDKLDTVVTVTGDESINIDDIPF